MVGHGVYIPLDGAFCEKKVIEIERRHIWYLNPHSWREIQTSNNASKHFLKMFCN